MSIHDRLAAVTPKKANRGCQTCSWLEEISEQDRAAVVNWLENDWSLRQLHYICSTDPDRPLQVSLSAFRNHVAGCPL